MPWLGFSLLPKRPTAAASTKKAASSSSSSSAAPAIDDFDTDVGTDEAPTVRMLKPEEFEKLQSENAQLKALIEQLASKAKEQGSSAGLYPNLASSPSSSSSSSSPPASNPLASGSTSGEYTFHKINDLQSILNHASAPSAPSLDSRRGSGASAAAMLSPQELAPVSDFYASLRQSLASSHAVASKPASAPKQEVDSAADELDDDWGESKSASKSPPAPDSVHLARTEDEAIVYNKHGSVVVHKKPLRPLIEDDADSSAAAAAASTTAAPSAGLDEFEDEFGMELESSSTRPTANGTADDPEEEIAIFDVSQADWWYVVPHPDRADEELIAAPQPPLDPAEDEDGFVVIKSKDSLTALSEFISSMMSRHPQIAQLSPEQLRDMLEQSMIERGIKEPSTWGKMFQLGKQAYSVFSWGSWALSLYRDQTAMRMVAAGVIKAATWTCVFLV